MPIGPSHEMKRAFKLLRKRHPYFKTRNYKLAEAAEEAGVSRSAMYRSSLYLDWLKEKAAEAQADVTLAERAK